MCVKQHLKPCDLNACGSLKTHRSTMQLSRASQHGVMECLLLTLIKPNESDVAFGAYCVG